MTLSPDLVPKYYVMDHKTEDLLPDATYLKVGMVVLMENPVFRVDISNFPILPDDKKYNARRYNRWIQIESVEIKNGAFIIIGVYADGRKAKLTHSSEHAWYVKKDSVPKISPEPIPWNGCTIIHETTYVDGRYVNIIKHIPIGEQEPNSQVQWEENLDYHNTRFSPEIDLRDLNRPWDRTDYVHFKDFLRGGQTDEPLADWEKELLEDSRKIDKKFRRQFGDGLNNDHGN